MLINLSIRNLAVAKSVSVDLEKGLNIITGETGAGKSVLVDALSLLRGARAEVSSIRDGSDFSEVSAQFKLSPTSKLWGVLEEQGIPLAEDDPECLMLRRVFFRNQKSKCFANGSAITQKTLASLASELIDISSQFENQRLLDPDSHTRYLDQYAGCSELFQSYQRDFSKVQALDRRIRDIQSQFHKRSREVDFLKFELEEIESAGVTPEEWSQIESMLKLGAKSQQIRALCSEMNEALSEGTPNCFDMLRAVEKLGDKLKRICPENLLAFQAAKLAAARDLLSDISFDVFQTQKSLDIDEAEFQRMSDRSEVYNKLFQKHGPSPADILAHAERCRQELDKELLWEEELKELSAELVQSARSATAFARELALKRSAALEDLASEIEAELGDLGMPNAEFVCRLVAETESPGSALETQIDPSDRKKLPLSVTNQLSPEELQSFSKLGRFGESMVRFFLSANPGLEPQPIEKVASGGELSRMMLAIKAVLIDPDSLNLFVFDEIDTGISGSIASKVGKKLAEFCSKRQAVCITHLPQVACYAHAHFIVSKDVANGSTSTRITKAKMEERYRELATMVSGQNVTPASLMHAKALVREARPEAET